MYGVQAIGSTHTMYGVQAIGSTHTMYGVQAIGSTHTMMMTVVHQISKDAMKTRFYLFDFCFIYNIFVSVTGISQWSVQLTSIPG